MTEKSVTTEIEIWKQIPGWESVYSVSSIGRIRRDVNARFHPQISGNVLKPTRTQFGYLIVVLQQAPKMERKAVHEFVARAFIGPRPKGNDINHISGNKEDNRPDNLEYCTRSENNYHAVRVLGVRVGVSHYMRINPSLIRVGENRHTAKLTEEQVRDIRKQLSAGIMSKNIAIEYGVHHTTIAQIKRRKSWSHI